MSENEEETYLFVGSSAVGLFKLAYGSQVRVLRYSTATAKGLGQNNSNSRHIWDMLATKYARVELSAVVWMFGNVDVKFSYYYKLCREWAGTMDDKPEPFVVMEQCANTYMQFVKKVHDRFLLPKQTQTRTVVIGAEPNGASPSVLFDQCVKYFVAPDTTENKKRIHESISMYHPELLRKRYNDTLKRICKENGFLYIDLDDKLLRDDAVTCSLEDSVTRQEYVDISPTSVHLNWEGNLKLYLDKFREIGIQISDTLDLDQTRDEYINEKHNRKRKPASVIEERWRKSMKTHIDDRDAKPT
jgi:hypothetical protein